MASQPELSVVIPTFERPGLLQDCLESLDAQSVGPGRFEAIVVDDGSGPATDDVLRDASGRMEHLRVAKQPVNRGPAAARNRGVKMAAAPLVLFVDDDMVVPPDLVAHHLDAHRGRDEKLGVVGLVDWLPGLPVSSFMRWLDSSDVQFNFAHMTAGPVSHPSDAFYTCNVSLARELFLETGGFDERFPYPAYEDTELAIRLSERGFHLEYRPVALAWHARAITLEIFCERMTKVGEAAVLLDSIQPDFPHLPQTDLPPYRAWRRLMVAGLGLAASTSRSDALRGRYYQHRVNAAFQAGLARGRSRLEGSTTAAAVERAE